LDLVLLLKAMVMGVVEGLTEFLPVSSTGHLILAGSLLGFEGGGLTPEKVKAFEISIQTGAILAIVLVYWQRLSHAVKAMGVDRNARRFLLNVFIGFLPAVVFGLAYGKQVQAALFSPLVVASTFILGGLIILWAERRQGVVVRVAEVEDMTPLDALKVGLIQCLAFVPGTSRSGSTIIGGMLLGLSRKAACGRCATAYTWPTCRCSAWASCSRSWRPGSACAGCCATCPPTTSMPSPGTASPSAC